MAVPNRINVQSLANFKQGMVAEVVTQGYTTTQATAIADTVSQVLNLATAMISQSNAAFGSNIPPLTDNQILERLLKVATEFVAKGINVDGLATELMEALSPHELNSDKNDRMLKELRGTLKILQSELEIRLVNGEVS